MGTPSPFEIGRGIGNNFNESFKRTKDENAIESILSQAAQSGDPQVLQQSIGKILQQVSPERRGDAVQFLQQSYNNVLARQKEASTLREAKEAGVSPHLPPAVQAQQLRDRAKAERIKNAYGTGEGSAQSAVGSQGQANPQANPNRPTDEQLVKLAGHPDKEISEPAKLELQRRQKQQEIDLRNDKFQYEKDQDKLKEQTRKVEKLENEIAPIRKEISDRAEIARRGLENKQKQLDLIDSGELTDPTVAAALEALPLKLGVRFLSPKTVEYKGVLVHGYGDLKNLFTGATRVKEIEILENKIADIYLTDTQKKAIILANMDVQKADIIREEAAEELDKDIQEGRIKPMGVIAYRKELDRRASPKINALFNRVIDKNKAIIQDAENMKKITLHYDDPEGREILEQILGEANGDRSKARQIAKQRGYTIGN